MNEYQHYQPNGHPSVTPFRETPVSLSAMAVAALILGVIALLTSFIPIINNISFLLALLGVVFGVVAVVATSRGTRRGKALAIAALIVNIVAVVLVLATQAMFGAIIDDVDKAANPSVVSTTTEQPANDPSSPNEQPVSSEPRADYSNLAVGTTAELDDGLSVSVVSIETGLSNYDGSAITGVTVSYVNNGSKEASFNPYDWKTQDSQGAQRNIAFYTEGVNELDSGSLAPGGTVSGNLYFDGEVSKVLYYSNMFYDSSVAWNVA